MRMSFKLTALALVLPLATVLLVTACQGRPSESAAAPAAGAPANAAGAASQADAGPTIKQLMIAPIDPLTDIVWDSVATINTPSGIEERRPKTDAEWQAVIDAATAVMDAADLLRTPGRPVTQPDEKSENPAFELEPREMQALIAADPETFGKYAVALREAMAVAVKHAKAKDAEGVMVAGEQIEMACESCHLKYWYPNQVIPTPPSDSPSGAKK